MKKAIEEKDLDSLNKLIAQVDDGEMKEELIRKFMIEIESLMNHYQFDEAYKIISHIESEWTTNPKA
jgi:hypothetical protein